MPREFVDSINIKSETQLESCILIANQLGFSDLWISNPSKGMKRRTFWTASGMEMHVPSGSMKGVRELVAMFAAMASKLFTSLKGIKMP